MSKKLDKTIDLFSVEVDFHNWNDPKHKGVLRMANNTVDISHFINTSSDVKELIGETQSVYSGEDHYYVDFKLNGLASAKFTFTSPDEKQHSMEFIVDDIGSESFKNKFKAFSETISKYNMNGDMAKEFADCAKLMEQYKTRKRTYEVQPPVKKTEIVSKERKS